MYVFIFASVKCLMFNVRCVRKRYDLCMRYSCTRIGLKGLVAEEVRGRHDSGFSRAAALHGHHAPRQEVLNRNTHTSSNKYNV